MFQLKYDDLLEERAKAEELDQRQRYRVVTGEDDDQLKEINLAIQRVFDVEALWNNSEIYIYAGIIAFVNFVTERIFYPLTD